jgi:hypothetical protein
MERLVGGVTDIFRRRNLLVGQPACSSCRLPGQVGQFLAVANCSENHRPDEEGIVTCFFSSVGRAVQAENHRPDEEGIVTHYSEEDQNACARLRIIAPMKRGLLHDVRPHGIDLAIAENHRPDEEGIVTCGRLAEAQRLSQLRIIAPMKRGLLRGDGGYRDAVECFLRIIAPMKRGLLPR